MVAADDMSAATTVDAALGYAALGWPVLPIVGRGKIPLTEHGLKDATTDADTITGWWSRWPDANVGIATGPPGPTVIDCDGPIGRHAFSMLVAGVGWQSSPWSCTGGGGWHVFYTGDVTVRNRAGFVPKVDVRGAGGYVVAPPSRHASGAMYEWAATPTERALVTIPDVVRAALQPPLRPFRPVTSQLVTGSNYGQVALEGEVAKVRTATVGTRNDSLVRSAFSLGQLVAVGKLDATDVAGALLAASGLPAREAMTTIMSGLKAGISTPRRP